MAVVVVGEGVRVGCGRGSHFLSQLLRVGVATGLGDRGGRGEGRRFGRGGLIRKEIIS